MVDAAVFVRMEKVLNRLASREYVKLPFRDYAHVFKTMFENDEVENYVSLLEKIAQTSPQLLTPSEYAKKVGISAWYARSLCRKAKLKRLKRHGRWVIYWPFTI